MIAVLKTNDCSIGTMIELIIGFTIGGTFKFSLEHSVFHWEYPTFHWEYSIYLCIASPPSAALMDFLACLAHSGAIPASSSSSSSSGNKTQISKSSHERNVTEEQDLDYFADHSSTTTSKTSKASTSKKQKKKLTSKSSKICSFHSLFPSLEQCNIFRKQHQIRIYSNDTASIPFPIRSWKDLESCWNIPAFLSRNILSNPLWETPTPIQMQSIPILLEGMDLIACAPTGSGKTLAFCLPIVAKLGRSAKCGFRALVVAPTKELAKQIYAQIHRLTLQVAECEEHALRACLLDKESLQGFCSTASKNFDILISTPLLLIQGVEKASIDLSSVSFVVFDEADRLLDMGFLEQADRILAACTSSNIQKALFSATISSSVESMAGTFMLAPVKIVIGTKGAISALVVSQKLLFIGQDDNGKGLMLKQLLSQGKLPIPCIVFVREIARVEEVVGILQQVGFKVSGISSQKSPRQREESIDDFRLGKSAFLVATDVLARGMDFKNVKCVLNYDCPETLATYVHRVGRTGRAGNSGIAITFFSKQDTDSLRSIGNAVKASGGEVPDWILSLKKYDNSQIRRRKKKLALNGGDSGAKVEKENRKKRSKVKEFSSNSDDEENESGEEGISVAFGNEEEIDSDCA